MSGLERPNSQTPLNKIFPQSIARNQNFLKSEYVKTDEQPNMNIIGAINNKLNK